MGIKDLNKFIRSNCSDESVKCIHLNEMSGKKIAVDISIYLYKYVGENNLIENMYLMLAIFKKYNIIPVFVFEGKSPAEKKALLMSRRNKKQEAEKEYNELKNALKNHADNGLTENQDIVSKMELLKKQFVYVNQEKINQVKELIRAFGMTYYDAPREADELCAMLVIKKKVWACLSEDMDMFVYGCSRVLRYFSFVNNSVVLYNTKSILKDLNITEEEFREICVLSGTDYNIKSEDDQNLTKTLKLFKKYKKAIKGESEVDCKISFYEWLLNNTKYIENYQLLCSVYKMFDLKNCANECLENFEEIKIMNSPMDIEPIRDILVEEGFIFCN
jgi:flap endonuclease-1